jgi:hypothetical protein
MPAAVLQHSCTIQSAVLNGFGDMRSGNRIRAGKIGNGSRHFEDAMIGARRESQAHNGLLEQGFTRCIRRAMEFDLSRREPGIGFVLPRRAGKSNWAFCSAARTRSLASFTSASGKPTMVKLGKPLARCASTVTSGASMPDRARLYSTARDKGSARFL